MSTVSPLAEHLVMTCWISGQYDVNRQTDWQADDYGQIAEWAASVAAAGLQGIVFHNNFSARTQALYEGPHLRFVPIEPDTALSPNAFRYVAYAAFLAQAGQHIKALFLTDASDVVLLQNPFAQPLFAQLPEHIFCGDEPARLDDPWMQAHDAIFRERIPGFAAYEAQHADATLLNCGIIGGHIGPMRAFIAELAALHQQYNRHNHSGYTGDMGLFNYLLRSRYAGRICHGAPVNTRFKGYENERRDCWFRHK